MPGKKIVATRGQDHTASRLCGCVKSTLKGCRVVRLAIASGAKVLHEENIICSSYPCESGGPQENCRTPPKLFNISFHKTACAAREELT
jgi:hypothetical protein